MFVIFLITACNSGKNTDEQSNINFEKQAIMNDTTPKVTGIGGIFVHILDPEGNKIELWEPIDSVFTEMGGPTTK